MDVAAVPRDRSAPPFWSDRGSGPQVGPAAGRRSSRRPRTPRRTSRPSDAHRHDHVGVVVTVRVERFHDRLAHLVLEIEADAVRLCDAQEIEHVLGVETDRHRRAGVVDQQRLLRLAELRAARYDLDLAPLNLELDRARPLVRQQRDAFDRIREAVTIEFDALVVRLRNDALEGRKLPVDHPGNQQPSADVEEQVVLAALVLNVPLAFAEQAPELEQRLARQDDADLLVLATGLTLALPLFPRHRDQGEAMAVG